MTDKEKYKAAFMKLLDDYQFDIDVSIEHDLGNNYCYRYCPFWEAYRNGACPARIQDNEEDYITNDDKCRDAIFNWYLEHVTKKEDNL